MHTSDKDLYKTLHRQYLKLLVIEAQLTVLASGDNMSKDVSDLIAAFDAATTRIAATIAKLTANTGLSADEKAAFQAEVDKLNALGSDPAQPIPPGV